MVYIYRHEWQMNESSRLSSVIIRNRPKNGWRPENDFPTHPVICFLTGCFLEASLWEVEIQKHGLELLPVLVLLLQSSQTAQCGLGAPQIPRSPGRNPKARLLLFPQRTSRPRQVVQGVKLFIIQKS